MENFIVSARKYRPSTFEAVVGQKTITNTLKNAIKNNHLAQAFLFCGPRGVGKTTCARILAKTINCENITTEYEACNECPSCQSFNESSSFNVYELDAASNNSVEDIRSLVDQVRIPPQRGSYKVYIIDEVHMLSASAFNAFLKTLEEPPSYAKFILATTEKHKILPTILSRCQIFDFNRIKVEDISKHLIEVAQKENITAEKDALHIIAQKADGALRDALSIFDQMVSFAGTSITDKDVIENLNILDYDYYFKLVDHFLNNNIAASLIVLDDIFSKGFDAHHFISGLGEHLRNLLVGKDKATIKLLEVGGKIKTKYEVQAEKCPQAFLLKALDINNKTDTQYRAATNKRLLTELNLMQLCSLTDPENPFIEKQKVKATAEKKTPTVNRPIDIASQNTKTHGEKDSQPVDRSKLKIDYGTTSLKNHGKKDQEKEDKVNEDAYSYKAADPFDETKLHQYWDEYTNSLRETNPSLHNTFSRIKPRLGENHQVTIILDNSAQKDEKIFIDGTLVQFLREKLNNYKIDILFSVEKIENTAKAYTDKEKFEQMTQNNPALKDLKTKLDLEINY